MQNSSSSIKKQGSYRHILKYTGLFGVVQVLKMLMDIIRNKIAAVFLGPSGIGLLGIYSKAIGMVSDSSSFGISISSVKHLISENEVNIYGVITTALYGLLKQGKANCCEIAMPAAQETAIKNGELFFTDETETEKTVETDEPKKTEEVETKATEEEKKPEQQKQPALLHNYPPWYCFITFLTLVARS